jgi:hypothetical protein
MRKPITIAMLISAAMHVALFMIADWLIRDRVEPSKSSHLLVINVQALDKEFDNSTELELGERNPLKVTEPQVKASIAKESAIASNSNTSLPRSKSAADALNRQPAIGLEHASARTAKTSASRNAGVSKPDVVESNVQNARFALAGASRNEPPVFATAEMSRRQEKMLTRKFRDWTENFYRMSDVPDGLTWKYKGQEYTAEFMHEAAMDDMGIERVTVVVSTEENGQKLSTEMRMKRLSFSNYAQFVNRWDDDVQIHDDELDGRFHSNTQINLTYGRKIRPQFHGQVTTSARRINIAERRGFVPRDEIFLGGLETGVKSIRLPKNYLPFADEGSTAEQNVHRFDRDTRIAFYDDGSYDWQTIRPGSMWQHAVLSGDTHFLVAGENVKLHVSGTVNGKVLVYSPERIIIEGDLVYAENPQEFPDADDFLGLASDKYVDVAAPDITGPGDLRIYAAIYAKRRFAVKRYRARGGSLLHIYGSLTAGTLSATEPRYATKIQFDQRLEALRPPRFPMTDRYAIESWDSAWRVEPAAASY